MQAVSLFDIIWGMRMKSLIKLSTLCSFLLSTNLYFLLYFTFTSIATAQQPIKCDPLIWTPEGCKTQKQIDDDRLNRERDAAKKECTDAKSKYDTAVNKYNLNCSKAGAGTGSRCKAAIDKCEDCTGGDKN